MTDRHEVLLLVNSQGAVVGIKAVSSEAAKAAASLNDLGTKGTAGLQKTGQAAAAAATGMAKVSTAATAMQRAASGVAVATLVGFLGDAARASADAEASMARLSVAFDNANTSVEAHAGALERAGQAALDMAF